MAKHVNLLEGMVRSGDKAPVGRHVAVWATSVTRIDAGFVLTSRWPVWGTCLPVIPGWPMVIDRLGAGWT
jgi:hypothetical protein